MVLVPLLVDDWFGRDCGAFGVINGAIFAAGALGQLFWENLLARSLAGPSASTSDFCTRVGCYLPWLLAGGLACALTGLPLCAVMHHHHRRLVVLPGLLQRLVELPDFVSQLSRGGSLPPGMAASGN